MRRVRQQGIPRSWSERETLRAKGQFWTPDWVADFMVAYVLKDGARQLFDPALGEGVFFRAAKRYAESHGFEISLFGREVDPEVLAQARQSGLGDRDLQQVELRDFVLDPPAVLFPAIVANPPYIRHHRLSPALKESLRDYARQATGRVIDGRAGLHVYFLIRALQTLSPGGRLAYIVSADICEGVFAQALWQWVTSHYRLDTVIAFAPDAAPFPDVDTNAMVFCICNEKPAEHVDWVQCLAPEPEELSAFLSGTQAAQHHRICVHRRTLAEVLSTGLSRPPFGGAAHRFALGDFATVKRGIVTGDNDFFFMTLVRAKELGIPESFLVRAVGRTRDVAGDHFGPEDLARLEARGRPTRLLNVNGLSFDRLPEQVQKYLRQGEERGVPGKTLIRTRKPWYRMETRNCPPIMFAYLGRRNARFIRNTADAVPLTCLLCVYPRQASPEFIDGLWKVLSHPDTIANLKRVGKSYGSGAIKVEPRALERLPLPDELVRESGLEKYAAPAQTTLFDGQ